MWFEMELRIRRVEEHRIGMEGGGGHCSGEICRGRVWNDESTQCKNDEVGEGWDEGAWNDCGVEGGDSGSFARGWHGNITRGLPHRGAQNLLPWVGEFRVVMDWEGGLVHLCCCVYA